MSTQTPKLQLKKPDSTDPFLLSDFHLNWDRLDAAPGLHICTSNTRPTWGGSQAGRTILETDTGMVFYFTGAGFTPIGVRPATWWASSSFTEDLVGGPPDPIAFGQNIFPGQSAKIDNLISLTPPYYANFWFIANFKTAVDADRHAGCDFFIQVNDEDLAFGGMRESMKVLRQYPLGTGAFNQEDVRVTTVMGVKALSKGETYNISVRVRTRDINYGMVRWTGAKIFALAANRQNN